MPSSTSRARAIKTKEQCHATRHIVRGPEGPVVGAVLLEIHDEACTFELFTGLGAPRK